MVDSQPIKFYFLFFFAAEKNFQQQCLPARLSGIRLQDFRLLALCTVAAGICKSLYIVKTQAICSAVAL